MLLSGSSFAVLSQRLRLFFLHTIALLSIEASAFILFHDSMKISFLGLEVCFSEVIHHSQHHVSFYSCQCELLLHGNAAESAD